MVESADFSDERRLEPKTGRRLKSGTEVWSERTGGRLDRMGVS
jgi:hypothetical protein